MTDTATIEALEADIARAEDECPNAPYVPVKIELAKQAASTIRALSAENERMRGILGESHRQLGELIGKYSTAAVHSNAEPNYISEVMRPFRETLSKVRAVL